MKYYYLLLLIALFCWNCQEDKLDTYDGQDGVYFINLYATRILTSDDWFSDTTNFSFALVNASDTVINLGVRVMGNMVDYDRTFRINYTTNATAGIHYDELESEYTIPANNSDSYIPIHIYREAIESDTTFYIELQLISNDNFAQNMPFKELIEDGVIHRHINKSTKYYKQKRMYFIELLERHLIDYATFSIPQGGLALWIIPLQPISPDQLLDTLEKHHLSIPVFCDSCGRTGMRIGYASLSEEELEKLVKELGMIFSTLLH